MFLDPGNPKKEISPNQSSSGDGIETINPTQSGWVWILRVCVDQYIVFFGYIPFVWI